MRAAYRGFGLGQLSCTCVSGTCLEDGNSCSSGPSGETVTYPPMYPTTYPTTPTSSTTPWWATSVNTAVAAGTKIATNLTNPIFNLAPGTYYSQTPYGTTVATAGAPSVPGLTSLSSSSMMPLLLIGGLVVVMMMAKR